jgi:antitoxin component of RelBE/YafQ-DinJ toxin-antitoxin module
MTTTITKPSRTSKITTTVRISRELKQQADEFVKSHGIDFTTLVHISLVNALRHGIQISPMENFTEK